MKDLNEINKEKSNTFSIGIILLRINLVLKKNEIKTTNLD